jgi:hypothetical protein
MRVLALPIQFRKSGEQMGFVSSGREVGPDLVANGFVCGSIRL